MSKNKATRLNKVLRELNISLDRAVEYLAKKGYQIDARPTTKISIEVYEVLQDGFEKDATKKAASKEVGEEKRKEKEAIRVELEAKIEKKKQEEKKKEKVLKAKAEKLQIKTVGKIDILPKKSPVKEVTKPSKNSTSSKPKEQKKAPKVEPKLSKLPPEKETKEKIEPSRKIEKTIQNP